MDDRTLETDPFKLLLNRFSTSLSENVDTCVEQAIQDFPTELSNDQLWELVKCELTAHQKRGKPIEIKDWIRRFPGLSNRLVAFVEDKTVSLSPVTRGTEAGFIDGTSTVPTRPASVSGGSSVGGPKGRSVPSSRLVVGSVFGAYQIIDVVGRGGMGIVYKAREISSDRVVALKTIHNKAGITDDIARRFSREARLASKLVHPNIVGAIDAGEVDGKPYIALEYVVGKNLSDIVTQDGALSPLTAVNYILQAAVGIRHAHRIGIIHRDIKPSNMLLETETGCIKVLDLGLARVETMLDDATRSADLTSTGAMFGTVDYMAPEQARDAKRADFCSDVYSLGCSLYFFLTGAVLYPGDSLLNKIRQHRDAPIPSLVSVDGKLPAVLQATFNRMVAKEPSDRLASMDEVIDSLELAKNVLLGSKADVLTATLRVKAKRKPKKTSKPNRLLAISGSVAAVLLAIVIGAYVWFSPKKEGSSSSPVVNDDSSLAATGAEKIRSLEWDWPTEFPAPARFPFDIESAKQRQRDWADRLNVPTVVNNSSGMALALIPPGEYTRGSQGDIFGLATPSAIGVDSIDLARPPSPVRITRPFQLSVNEVTVAQFKKFVDATGYKTVAEQSQKGGWYFSLGDLIQKPDWTWQYNLSKPRESESSKPVVFVTRQDAEALCGWLSQTEKATYRLPTEAEWEFACRAGSTARFGVSDTLDELASVAWANEIFSLPVDKRTNNPTPHAVATKAGNPFGLHDMLGNVWELCQDGWVTDYYRLAPRDNPVAPSTFAGIMRGGSFVEAWPDSNPFVRIPIDRPQGNVGFRVVRELPVIEELEPPTLAPMPEPGQPIGKRSMVSSPAQIQGLRSWSVETVGFRGSIASVAYSPTAKLVAASSSTDPVIRIYNDRLSLQRVFVGPAGNVSCVAFSPDGKHLAAASWGSDWDNGIRVWELSSGRIIYHDDSKQWVPRVTWSPDGKYLAYPQSVVTRVVDFRSGVSRSVSGSHDHEFCWSADGKRFAVRDNSFKIRIYETATFVKLREFEVRGAHLNAPMSWSPDGSRFALLQESGDVKLLDGNEFNEKQILKPNQSISNLLWTTDSKRLVLIGSQTSVWDVETSKSLQSIAVGGVADWVAADQTLVIGRPDGIIEIRPLNGSPTGRSADRGRPMLGTALISPDGSELVTRTGADLMFWNSETGDAKESFTNSVALNSELSWAPDGKKLAAWADKKLLVVGRSNGQTIVECVGHEAAITTCNWNPSSDRLVSVSNDNTMRVWDVVKGTELAQQKFETPPQDAAWSHDGKSLAVIRKGELIFVAADGSTILDRHPTPGDYAYRIGSGHGLAWSPSDLHLTTGIYSDRVVTWNVAENNWDAISLDYQLAPFVGAMSWSSDGKRLIAATTYQDAASIDIQSGKSRSLFPCANGQWRADSHLFMTGLVNNLELYGFDADHHERTGVLVPVLSGGSGKSLCLSPDGHVRGDMASIVYVALTEDGRQLTYRQAEFEKEYGWKNDPARVKFLKANDRQASPLETTPNLKDLVGPLGAPGALEPLLTDATLPAELLSPKLVSRPQPIDTLRNWTIEMASPRGPVNYLAYHPNGQIIAAAGHDGVVRLWDRQCRLVGMLVDAAAPLRACAWSQAGHCLATVGDDRILRIWDIENSKLLRRISLPYLPTAVHWQPSGNDLAIEGSGGTVRVRAATSEIDEIAHHPDNGVHVCEWSPDGKTLAIVQWQDMMFLDAESLDIKRRVQLSPSIGGLSTIQWTPDGSRILGLHGENFMHLGVWDATTGVYLGEANAVCALHGNCLSISKDGKRVLAGGGWRHLFDIERRGILASVPTHYTQASLSPDGNEVAALRGNSIAIVEPVSGKEISRSIDWGTRGWGNFGVPANASLSADGQHLIFAFEGSQLLTFDPESGGILQLRPFTAESQIYASPNGDRIVVKSGPGNAISRVDNLEKLTLEGATGALTAAAWSSDGEWVAATDNLKKLRIWKASDGKLLQEIALPEICDWSLRWRAGNQEITVVASTGNALRIDAAKGAILETRKLAPHQRPSLDYPFPDEDRRLILEAGGLTRIASKSLNRDLGHLITGIGSRQYLCIGPTGHWRGPVFADQFIRYVAVDVNGQQSMHTPQEFASRFQWHNNPVEASLAKKQNEPPPTPPVAKKMSAEFAQDRQVAEKVLELGGWVRIRQNGINVAVQNRAQIPTEPFEVREIELSNSRVTDDDLTMLQGLGSLRMLSLGGCRGITNDALSKIGSHFHLKTLALYHSSLTEAGVQLAPFRELENLNLDGLPLTDSVIEQLSHVPRLQSLSLGGTSVTDAIGASLVKLKDLRSLSLPATVTDATLERLGQLPLNTLGLAGDKITDRSAPVFKELRQLRFLSFSATSQGDATFEAISGTPIISFTYVGSKLSEQGAAALANMQTVTDLYFDHGELKDGHLQAIGRMKGLRNVDLRGNKLNSTKGGAVLAQLTEVTQLKIHRIVLDDEALSKMITPTLNYLVVYDCPGMTGQFIEKSVGSSVATFRLTGSEIQPNFVNGISKFQQIQTLVLDGNMVSAEVGKEMAKLPMLSYLHIDSLPSQSGVSFSNLASLSSLHLGNASLLNLEDFRNIANTPKLSQLHISLGTFTEDHFKAFASVASLQSLTLQDCKIPKTALETFRNEHPDLKISVVGGIVE